MARKSITITKAAIENAAKKMSAETTHTEGERQETLIIRTVEIMLTELSKAHTEAEKCKNTIESKIAAVTEKYGGEMNQKEASEKAKHDQLKEFADANRSTLFKDGRKSRSTKSGTISYKLSKQKLVSKEGHKLDEFLDIFVKECPNVVKMKQWVAPELIIAYREDERVQSLLRRFGFEIEQEEKFNVDLKKRA